MEEFSTSLYLLKVTYISSSGSCISWSCPSPPLSAISAATLCLWKKIGTMRLIYDREKRREMRYGRGYKEEREHNSNIMQFLYGSYHKLRVLLAAHILPKKDTALNQAESLSSPMYIIYKVSSKENIH